MAGEFRYDVDILHLFVSPAHAYFGGARDGAADVPTADAEVAELWPARASWVKVLWKAAHMDAAVTLFTVESLEAIAAELGAGPSIPC